MRLPALTAAAATLALLAAPASASWKDPQWGTSLEDTFASLSAGAERIEDVEDDRVDGQHHLIVEPSQFSAVPVTVQYYFERGETLSLIRVKPASPDGCDALYSAALEVYEPATRADRDESRLMTVTTHNFLDPGGTDTIRLVLLLFESGRNDICHVLIRPQRG